MNAAGPTVRRRETEAGLWENIERAPRKALRQHVLSYQGYIDTSAPALTRHVAATFVPLIIGFEAPLMHAGTHFAPVEHRSFVAGLQEAPVITKSTGISSGLQVNLTPIGAYRLFGRPMHEIANKVVSVEDVFGAEAGRLLVEALRHAATWEERFDLLDAVIAHRFAGARPASPAVAWAAHAIEAAGGNASITGLAEQIGWSRKHLVIMFREQVGLPPKTFSRVARFSRAVRILRSGQDLRWIDLAHVCGYYDQAHFVRDFSQFAGVSPTRYVDRHPGEGVEDVASG